MNSIAEIWNTELNREDIANINRDEISTTSVEQEVYKENILDHYRNPQNKKTLEEANTKHTSNNPLCGDTVTIFLEIKNNKVQKATFQGSGCAISQAAASMLTEKIKQKNIQEIKEITKQDIINMLGIHIGPVRLKCATLAIKTTLGAIENYDTQN